MVSRVVARILARRAAGVSRRTPVQGGSCRPLNDQVIIRPNYGQAHRQAMCLRLPVYQCRPSQLAPAQGPSGVLLVPQKSRVEANATDGLANAKADAVRLLRRWPGRYPGRLLDAVSAVDGEPAPVSVWLCVDERVVERGDAAHQGRLPEEVQAVDCRRRSLCSLSNPEDIRQGPQRPGLLPTSPSTPPHLVRRGALARIGIGLGQRGVGLAVGQRLGAIFGRGTWAATPEVETLLYYPANFSMELP